MLVHQLDILLEIKHFFILCAIKCVLAEEITKRTGRLHLVINIPLGIDSIQRHANPFVSGKWGRANHQNTWMAITALEQTFLRKFLSKNAAIQMVFLNVVVIDNCFLRNLARQYFKQMLVTKKFKSPTVSIGVSFTNFKISSNFLRSSCLMYGINLFHKFEFKFRA